MERLSSFIFVFIAVVNTLFAQTQCDKYAILFYNLENLFDTINDPNTFDDDFTPYGVKKWNSERYWKKIGNVGKVFDEFAKSENGYPIIAGIAEIENRNVLQDIVSSSVLSDAGYGFVHYDSPDARGMDVALLYCPRKFKFEKSAPFEVKIPLAIDSTSRDILAVWGTIQDERFCFIVCHWPSRVFGKEQTEFKRIIAANVVRSIVDSVNYDEPDINIIILGDMNDEPVDKSFKEVLRATGKKEEMKQGDLFNPFEAVFHSGQGTSIYRNNWNLFDNILVNGNLLDGKKDKFKLLKPVEKEFYGYIYNPDFLHRGVGKNPASPLRTYISHSFRNGYSDHFPVYIYIGK